MSDEIDITVRLPLGEWRILTALAERSIADVQAMMAAVYAQVNVQVSAANESAAARARAAECELLAAAAPPAPAPSSTPAADAGEAPPAAGPALH